MNSIGFTTGFISMARCGFSIAKIETKIKIKAAANIIRRAPNCRRWISNEPLLHTSLFDLHAAHGARMVPFAGYAMPVLYDGQTHLESHQWVRTKAGLFDVSHMVQHVFSGPKATEFLESLTPSGLTELQPFQSTLSSLLLPTGGIVDDLMITKQGDDQYFAVTNAACREKDILFFQRHLETGQQGGFAGNVHHEVLSGWSMLALQGPLAAEVLQKLTRDDLTDLKFGYTKYIGIQSLGRLHVSRGGYTGEDGFEISVPKTHSLALAELILGSSTAVKLAGLAARDSLRLEAGMCLYGHDIDEWTTPVEAGLSWTIGRRRRSDGGFNGYETISNQLASGVSRRRVGFTVEGPAAREGAVVYAPDDSDKVIGRVTSGSYSPSLGINIGMAYIDTGFNKIGNKVLIDVRGKKRNGELVKMPFVSTNYYR
ncbi:uncharacterized protein V1516DRAFT_713015 [Lipomyces oligophaga]|uniref:uncharacterized protein n=1 Tax=Lipomyces oligophaga TaxID=45792 RepID=UPI0034CFA04B